MYAYCKAQLYLYAVCAVESFEPGQLEVRLGVHDALTTHMLPGSVDQHGLQGCWDLD